MLSCVSDFSLTLELNLLFILSFISALQTTFISSKMCKAMYVCVVGSLGVGKEMGEIISVMVSECQDASANIVIFQFLLKSTWREFT